MHLAEQMQLPRPYLARPYRGAVDHPAMTEVLSAHRLHAGDPERPSVERMDLTYAHLENCDTKTDVVVVETTDGDVVGYGRASYEDLGTGVRDLVVFAPIRPEHLRRPLFEAIVRAEERHMARWVDGATAARYRAHAKHPGPERPAADDAAWLEALGYIATEWSAWLLRSDLDDIPDRALPDGVEVRPVSEDQVRTILAAHFEAFRGEWDFHEATEADFLEAIEDPRRDTSLWQVAWADDVVVGQVKPYIDHEENSERGTRRGYTEYISTHRDWRNRGIAGALLAMSLRELRARGMTEAAMGVDTNNPGGAFHVYTGLGFVVQNYEAVYTRPLSTPPG